MRGPLTANAVALIVGAGGGFIFWLAGLPLAWMLGAMCATTVAALAGARLAVWPPLRAVMIAVLGVMLGSAFSPDLLDRLGPWLAGVLTLAVYVPLGAGLVYLYFRRFARFDPVTAYFASTPGGFGEMVLTGEAMGGDVRAISLVHATRVLVVVFIIPFWYRFIAGLDVPTGANFGTLATLGIADAVLLALSAAVGWSLARLLRLPAAALVGPMIVSAGIHLAGVTAAPPPGELVSLAQVVVGTAVGARFVGVAWRTIARIPLLALGSTAILLALTVVFAAVVPGITGLQAPALALSLAPGGLAEMSLIALALGVDTAFVSTMHLVRIAIIVMLAPTAFRLFGARR